MSSTLSEGVRVPDIGSVNWGADVNFNWGLLNTCLANISGNVKTDAENTWTAPQTFTETISGSIDGVAARAVGDEDGNNIKAALAGKQPSLSQSQLDACNSGITASAVQQIGTNADNISSLQTAVSGKAADDQVVHLAGAETITGDKTFTGATATHNITPETDNTYSLGSSTLAWSAVYANTYYYGGTEFQNKFVTLDTAQTISGDKTHDAKLAITGNNLFAWERPQVTLGTLPSSTIYYGTTRYRDANTNSFVMERGSIDKNGTTNYGLVMYPWLSTSNSKGWSFYTSADGASAGFHPIGDNVDLGIASHKWKTLNGINPGALGMIDTSTSVDIDTSGWVSDGSTVNRVYINGANPTFPGYLFIRASGSATDFLSVRLGGSTPQAPLWTAPYYPVANAQLHVVVPCPANTPIRVYNTVAPAVCKYFACLGNV